MIIEGEMAEWLSNPVTMWRSGSEQRAFNYDAGYQSKLFHVHVSVPGHILCNVLMYAQSPEHITDILAECRDFMAATLSEYEAAVGGADPIHTARITRWDTIVRALKDPESFIKDAASEKGAAGRRPAVVRVVQAPRNQLFKVAWAGNDYI